METRSFLIITVKINQNYCFCSSRLSAIFMGAELSCISINIIYYTQVKNRDALNNNSACCHYSIEGHVCLSHMSLVVKKPVFGISDLVRHKPAVQSLKMARGLKFWI